MADKAPAPVEAQPDDKASEAQPIADKVEVRAIRTFGGEDGHKTPESEPFLTRRVRAHELRQHGLIEYVNPEDEYAVGGEAAKASADAHAKRLAARPGLPESAKAPPLKSAGLRISHADD